MLIGYSQPAITGSVAITQATWQTADSGTALFDGKPGRATRMKWGSGTPTLGQYVQITATFAAATPLRILGLLGTTLPVGVKVSFLGPGAAALGGTTSNARTLRLPDGSVGIWAVGVDDGIADTGIVLRIYNDANGSTWASNGTMVDLGELVSMPGVEIDHGRDWAEGYEDPSDRSRTRGAQVNTIRRSPYRTYAIPCVTSGTAQVRGGGLANGLDWTHLRALLAGDTRAVVIPRSGLPDALDATAINATALYGTGSIDNIRHLGGDWYSADSEWAEIPAK